MPELNGSLPQIILERLALHPDKTGVADPHQSLTREELLTQAKGLAVFLRKLNVDAGDNVMFCMPNSVNFIALHMGILLNGSVSVPLEFGISEFNFKYIFEATRPTTLILHKAVAEKLSNAIEYEDQPAILIVNDAGDLVQKEKVVDAKDISVLAREYQPTAHGCSGDLASIMFTSGSTGKPKGVKLTHCNVVSALNNIIEFCAYSAKDFEVITLPLSHNFGLGHAYCSLFAGGSVYTENGMTRMKRVLKAMSSYGATGFPTTPAGVALIVDRYGEKFAEASSQLRFMVVNSAPLPAKRTKQLQLLLPDVDIMVYYGLTEASRSTFINLTSKGPAYYDCVGKPMAGIEVKIDQNNREVLIKGATVTSGYWQQPDLTAETFVDGYMHTGDMGRFDKDGNLFIIGRLKDQINVGGYKVDPNEVDAVLTTHPAIAQSTTFGADVSADTQQIVSFVVLEPDATVLASDLIKLCKSELEYYKVPEKIVTRSKLPRNDSGKIIRKELVPIFESGDWEPLVG